MAKLILIIFLFFSFLQAAKTKNVYENNCVKCHKKLPVSIDKYFYRYLLKYSSEKNVKNSLREYLQNPTVDTTVMPEAFVKRYGIKKKTTLTDEELRKAIDIYWEKYKVFGKLK